MSTKLKVANLAAILLFTTALSWTIDYSDLLGPAAQSVVDKLRWVCIVLTIALAAQRVLARGIFSHHLMFGVIVVIALLIPSVIFSSAPQESLIQFVRLLSIVAVIAVVDSIPPTARHAIVVATFSACLFVVVASLLISSRDVIVGNFGELLGNGFDRERFKGISPHPNVLAYLCTIVATYGIVALGEGSAKTFAAKIRHLFGLVMAFVVCVATGSRSGFAWLVLMPLFYIALKKLKWLRFTVGRWLFSIGVLAVMCIPLVVILSSLDANMSRDANSYANSNAERVGAWHAAWDNFIANPIFGHGWATGVVSTGAASESTQLLYSHNALLTWLSDAGVFGGISILIVVAALSFRALEGFEALGDGAIAERVDRRFSALCLLGVVVFATVEGALQGVYSMALFAAMCYGVAGSRDRRQAHRRVYGAI